MNAATLNRLYGGHACRDGPGRTCQWYDWDEVKAARLFERLEALGAVCVYASPDLCHMLVPTYERSAYERGFILICDPDLPPNSLVDQTARRLQRAEA